MREILRVRLGQLSGAEMTTYWDLIAKGKPVCAPEYPGFAHWEMVEHGGLLWVIDTANAAIIGTGCAYGKTPEQVMRKCVKEYENDVRDMAAQQRSGS